VTLYSIFKSQNPQLYPNFILDLKPFFIFTKELIHQTKQEKVTTFSEIEWRNNITLQIKNDKIRSFLVNIQEYDKQIQVFTFL
jgi:hypothetical protein